MPNPAEIIISITNRCNLKCKMCDIPRNRIDELSTSYWKQTIKDAASCGARAIVFSGGEPLLREDIFELISFTKDNALSPCLTSNGYLIQDGIAQKLRESGIDVVNISIEGPRNVHDYLRGKGMFEKATAALENLRKFKIESTIATMVSRYNYKYLPSIIELAKQHGATTIKFQPFSRIFLNDKQGSRDFLLSGSEIKEFAQILEDVIGLSTNHAITTNPRGYLEMMPSYLSKKHIDMSKGCSALENSCPINCNGDIYPCWVLSDKDNLIGNIKENSFLSLWGSQKHQLIIKRIKEKGCCGCMMSCYDDNFGRDTIDRRISLSMKRLQKKGVRQYALGIFKKWLRRIRFYSSYRGTLKGIAVRFQGLLSRKRKLELKLNQEEVVNALKEIELARRILEEELNRSK